MLELTLVISYCALIALYLKHALHVFQQNHYEFERYTKWLLNPRNYKLNEYFIFAALIYLADYAYTYFFGASYFPSLVIILLFAIYRLCREEEKEYIKALVYTKRVKRQLLTIGILTVAFFFFLLRKKCDLVVLAIITPLLAWLLIYPTALINLPWEKLIKKHYEKEARELLRNCDNLKTIGITGSYGKTSTKNIVNNILAEHFDTLMTPASYNTPMGITKTIREQLTALHEVFVCELGADHVGEITYLMDFVKPQYTIVTAIGPQHLNTFHSLENIIKEKMQAVEKLPADGMAVLNIDNQYIREYQVQNPVKIVTVSTEGRDADYVAYDLKYGIDGVEFKVKSAREEFSLKSVLLGVHNITNILLAVALAKELGLSNEEIRRSVAKCQAIAHRLELKTLNGFRFIDNAFNSNPVSSKLSLDVLAKCPGQRVIVTPGLIDLGSKEEAYNREFGAYMVGRADFAVLVGPKQTKAIVQGLKDAAYDLSKVTVVKDVKAAFAYLYQNFSPADTILLENDLPDAFSN